MFDKRRQLRGGDSEEPRQITIKSAILQITTFGFGFFRRRAMSWRQRDRRAGNLRRWRRLFLKNRHASPAAMDRGEDPWISGSASGASGRTVAIGRFV